MLRPSVEQKLSIWIAHIWKFAETHRTLIGLLAVFLPLYYLEFYLLDDSASQTSSSGTVLFNPLPVDLQDFDPSIAKKIAFLFLIKTTLPLASIWANFFRDHQDLYSVYINMKLGHELQLPEEFRDAKISNFDAYYGDFSMMSAELSLVASALSDKTNGRFILVSDSCIPIYDFNYFYKFLMNSTMNYVSIITDEPSINLDRYNFVYMPEITKHKWTKGVRWFTLTRSIAVKIHNDSVYLPKFKRFCPSTASPRCVAYEHYIQTFMRITALEQTTNYSLTWEDWEKCDPCIEPRSYSFINKKIIDKVRDFRCPRSDGSTYPCYLIARKFREQALPDLLHYSSYLGY